jgi:probable rRNA maturation factor
MAFEIDLRNNQAFLAVDPSAVRRAVAVALRAEQVSSAVISVTIVDNSSIHRLNREYLQHDYPTDVISFALTTGPTIEGEIIASAEMACQMAIECGWEAASELTLYVVHGLLHLCGYDDLTPEDQAIMREREREILALLGLTGSGR